ncbi:MHYT domain-containing protein [Tateyamaria pelophila]|uniref:MHYT domain-containing protein n=1 Tax=Tateyamaria pelophila TaxID=328415 RepID=UPI001CBA95CE|nr:MHYT domain-containing protein [Tateyamaria pelophila]
MLEHGHNHYLVIASLAVALMSAFTGLSLTKGASRMPVARRKVIVSMSAFALGGGIWSMHFVAMLGMTLPVSFHYDALVTLLSALVAILLTGLALLFVHFGERTPWRISLAGLCAGVGILAMHYIGMSGIQDVEPVYATLGLAQAIVAALVLCVVSFWICYSKRGSRNIVIGTIVFGGTVFAVHFIAMAGTHFIEIEGAASSGLWLSNEMLAFGVTFSAFVISGAFLLVGVTFAGDVEAPAKPADAPAPVSTERPPVAPEPDAPALVRLPYEKNGQTHFVSHEEVAAVRAEGRYTFLYHPTGRLFCPWSITLVEERLAQVNFLRCHRSYLVNVDHVASFERRKDNGVCFFDGSAHLDKAPVSRSYLKQVRARFGI